MARHRQGTLHGEAAVRTVTDYADWRDRSHWNNGRRRPCWACGRLAFLLDHHGRPAHKVCVDAIPDAAT